MFVHHHGDGGFCFILAASKRFRATVTCGCCRHRPVFYKAFGNAGVQHFCGLGILNAFAKKMNKIVQLGLSIPAMMPGWYKMSTLVTIPHTCLRSLLFRLQFLGNKKTGFTTAHSAKQE